MNYVIKNILKIVIQQNSMNSFSYRQDF